MSKVISMGRFRSGDQGRQYVVFWSQGRVRWVVEVADIKGRGNYYRNRVEVGNDLTPPA